MFQLQQPLLVGLGTRAYEGPGADTTPEALHNRLKQINSSFDTLGNVLTACGPLEHDVDGGTFNLFSNNFAFNDEQGDTFNSVLQVHNYQHSHAINSESYALYVDGGLYVSNNYNAKVELYATVYVRNAAYYYGVNTYETGSTVCGTITGCSTLTVDYSGITWIKLPYSASPTVSANGQIGINSTVTNWSHGVVYVYAGEQLAVVTLPVAQIAAPTDGHVLTYDGTNDEFKLAAGTPATVVTSTNVITDNRVVRGDGGSRGVQESAVTIDDSGNVTGVGTLNASGTITADGGLTIPSGDTLLINGTLRLDDDGTFYIEESADVKVDNGSAEMTVVLVLDGLDVLPMSGSATASGTHTPGTLANTTGGANPDWSPLSLPTSVAVGTALSAENLHLTNFGFGAIPDDATIVGIEAVVTKVRDSGGTPGTAAFQLVLAGSTIGSGKSVTYPTVSAAETLGGAADAWGASLTGADLKSSGFGVQAGITASGSGTVTYTISALTLKAYWTGGTAVKVATNNQVEVFTAAKTFPNTGLKVYDTNASHTLALTPGSDLTANRTLTLTTGDADRTVTLSGNLTVESASLVNQDLTSDATPTFAGATLTTDFFKLGTATELTIASGVVTATRSHHTIDTQSDDATDDLDTINGGSSGRILVIYPADSGRTVVVKHGTGNIRVRGGADITLDDAEDTAWLIHNGTNWLAI